MDGTNSTIESERSIATVMFADISGFTAMSEKMDPEQVTCAMNDCFCMMEGMHRTSMEELLTSS